MEKLIISLSALIIGSQGFVIHNGIGPRIVNGTDVAVGEIPYQISINSYGTHFCGGSILNKNYVVTAAHCTLGMGLSSGATVVAGTIAYKQPHQKRNVVKVVVHKGFNLRLPFPNDIALLKVEPPFEFDKLVQPATLPKIHEKTAANKVAVVSGWGYPGGMNHTTPDILQKAEIFIVDQDKCRKAVEKGPNGMIGTVLPSQICASNPSFRKGACNGDSGGPLTVDGTLVGIVSWAFPDPYCASLEFPTVYTRVSEFIDWINENMD